MRFLPFVLLLLLSFPPLVQARELRVALGAQDEPASPQAAAGQRKGLTAFNEDLAREICRQMQARCVAANVPFTEMLPGIEAQKFELGFGNFLRTPEREKRVAFSDSIWRSSSRLVATPATARRFTAGQGADISIETLRAARVVAVTETQQHRYLQGIASENQLTVLSAASYLEALTLLRHGKADFCLLPMLRAYVYLGRDESSKIEFVGAPIASSGLGGSVHIALPKDDEGLRLAVNKAIAELRADGSYHRIVRRHFPFNLD